MNDLSHKAYAWLMATLISLVLLIAMLINIWSQLHTMVYYLECFMAFLAGVATLYCLYRVWDDMAKRRQTRKLEREKHESERWIAEQTMLHQHELERDRLHLEEQRLQLEQRKVTLAAHLERSRVIVPEGSTAIFVESDGYTPIASPRGAAQLGKPGKEQELAAPSIARQLAIPRAYDLLTIFRRMDVAPENVFLGIAEGGDYLTVDSHKKLCHGVFNAVTGRGKTVIERGIVAQLLHVGHEVILADLKFSLIDETGLDYRPIARKLLSQPSIEMRSGTALPHLLVDVEDIKAMVEWLATTEIPRRLKLYHRGIHTYKTLYVFLEEFLYLVRLYPEVAGYVETIITVGRALGVKLFTVAQNFLARDTKLSGAMRENFETAYYLGGDDHSGAVILDMSKKDLVDFLNTNTIVLGQGLAMLRNNTVAPQARLVRVGMASNEAIWYLLGRADDFTLPESGRHVLRDQEDDDEHGKPHPKIREQTGFPFRAESTRPSPLGERQGAHQEETGSRDFRKVVTGELVHDVRPLQQQEASAEAETSQASDDGKYKFSEAERSLVIELYKAYRSIDKVLAHFNRGGRWHKDASRILKEAGLL